MTPAPPAPPVSPTSTAALALLEISSVHYLNTKCENLKIAHTISAPALVSDVSDNIFKQLIFDFFIKGKINGVFLNICFLLRKVLTKLFSTP